LKFAPIHNHSEYSALDGLSTCKEIMQRCQCIGCTHVGLTDHGTVAGHLEFAKQAVAHDIQPVFGCELYHGVFNTKEERLAAGHKRRDQAHLVAVAQTNQGLRNLWSLVTASHRDNFYHVGRVNWDMLNQYSEGLIVTSGCIQGLVSQDIMGEIEGDMKVERNLSALNQYLDIFGDNFYVEVHTYPGPEHEALNKELVALAQERGLPLVYATDAHFASPEQYDFHDAYIAMQTRDTILVEPEERKMWHPKSLYIQDEDQIRESLSYLPESAVGEALFNSAELAESCHAMPPDIHRQLPVFIPAESGYVEKEDRDLTAAQLFVSLVEEGLVERYGDPSDEVINRALTEIGVFLEGGLEHYFLQAWDFVQFCDEKGIERGPGRGSAAGAIVSYALGITDVDPLEFDLIFERFYNPGRAEGFPDIDNDFPTLDRPRIKAYMEKRWGEDRVAQIGTVMRMKPLSAIKKMHTVCGIGYSEMEALKKIVHEVPDIDILGHDSVGWSEESDPGKTVYVMSHVGDEIEKWAKEDSDEEESRRRFLTIVEAVCSRVSGYGLHPSGVVVSKVPLDNELPLMWNASQKMLSTQFPMSDVDRRGFVKQDFLGLANLDILAEWKRLVEPTLGEIDWDEVKKEVEAEEDHSMWKLYDKGLTLGLFQIEDGYARHLCKELKPRSIEDLGIIVALNRPGPIRSGAPDSFVARKYGLEPVTYDHPILEDILEPTYGWFLYQEQIIRFFGKLGLNESDADAVRKILGKKKPEDMTALYNGTGEWKGKGYKTLADNFGIDPETAQTIWDKVEDFAKYSFNKSHAIAYGVLCFRTGYAKWADTPHFAISCIRIATKQKKKKEDIGKYVSEARRMAIAVALPDIDKSLAEISVVDGDIYYGFSDIKGIGKNTAEEICRLRDEYDIKSADDLFVAIEVEQSLWEEEKKATLAEGLPFKKRSARQTVPQNRIPSLTNIGAFDKHTPRDANMRMRQDYEKELLGLILTDESEEILRDNIDELDGLDGYEALEFEDAAIVPGIVSDIVPKKTRKDGKSMGIVTIEYNGQQIEFVVFPQDWKSYKFLWKERTVAVFSLVKGDRGVRFKDGQMLVKERS
jgi:DNA polymerase III subunit alpha